MYRCNCCQQFIVVVTPALGHTFVDGNCSACGAADPDYVAPVVENKTITIGDKTFTAADGKWVYNTEVTDKTAAKYSMIIFDKNYEGTFTTNGWGIAIVLDANGTLVKIYDGAWNRYYDANGRVMDVKVDANLYAVTAWNELQDGEILVIFPNDGVNNAESGRTYAKSLADGNYSGQSATLEGFEFQAPACQHTSTKTEGAVEATCEEKGFTGNTVCADCGELIAEGTEIAALGHNYEGNTCTVCGNPKTFDVFGILVAVMAASGTALVCLKKKED